MLASELTAKERAFAEAYVIDFNASKAALAVGYDADGAGCAGHNLIHRPQVAEYIEYLKAQRSIRTKVTSDYVLNAIVETLERCRQAVKPQVTPSGVVAVVQDADGNPANAYKFDAKSVLKAAELLGKHLAMFTDVVDNRMTFTQMGEVKVGDAATGEAKALTFDVGSDPETHKAIP